MKQEIWKTAQFIFTDGHIEIYENYEVSNWGNVRSVNYKNTKLMNRPDQSKPVRVTFSDKTQRVFPSAKEAGRNIGIRPDVVSVTINQRGGYYKRLGLHFEYV